MQELFDIIVELMKRHSCVVVPGLGGFVINAKEAVADHHSDYFLPPSKELVFNSRLSHNDGLLAHALMVKLGVSFDEADRIIAEKVAALKAILAEKGVCEVGEYGYFTEGRAGTFFNFKKMEIEDVDSFGLHEFYFPEIEEKEEKAKKEKSSGFAKSFPKLLGGISAVLAVMLVCQPVNNGASSDMATLSPLPKMKLYQETTPNQFYLVVAGFSTEKEALTCLDSLSALGSASAENLDVYPKGGRFIVSCSPKTTLDEAVELKNDLIATSDSVFSNSYILGLLK
ncbi:MAG TPA: hypothetical protein PLN63_00380 [Paludibacteraceae bacterium]|nr:hypothetical protein [Paludibacteraceae bacterium]HOU67018.1 hypothetical protein [Paludibacteraceae bacterium]HPH62068.1 hypothetical protein [Paludibacteraceae bacterium]HQF49221.1 hypothetical protein [Paludibacteraceae bacterium]HQJ89885.1 hypothetical protein [Paludibacteraceae bacterium]